jgi:CRISPR-associated endonuclease/helicase Cas3
MSRQVVLFKAEGKLFHGGDYNQRSDRDKSVVSLSPKLAKGHLDPEYQCLRAIVGKDIDYHQVGVYDVRFTQAVQNFL